MYEKLIKELLDCSEINSLSHYKRDLMKRAAHAIAERQWIPLTERPPLLTTPVLVTDGIEMDISWMYGVPPRWHTAMDENKITHWMPLPYMPKAAEAIEKLSDTQKTEMAFDNPNEKEEKLPYLPLMLLAAFYLNLKEFDNNKQKEKEEMQQNCPSIEWEQDMGAHIPFCKIYGGMCNMQCLQNK